MPSFLSFSERAVARSFRVMGVLLKGAAALHATLAALAWGLGQPSPPGWPILTVVSLGGGMAWAGLAAMLAAIEADRRSQVHRYAEPGERQTKLGLLVLCAGGLLLATGVAPLPEFGREATAAAIGGPPSPTP